MKTFFARLQAGFDLGDDPGVELGGLGQQDGVRVLSDYSGFNSMGIPILPR